MTIGIVTDSTCDLPQETIDKYNIRVIPMYIHAAGESYRDGVDLTRQEFYTQLPGFDPAPTTAAPGLDVFRESYESLAREGATEILSIHISKSLSAVLDVAHLSAKETTSVPVSVIDSRQLSLGTGFLVEEAAKAATEGKTKAEIIEQLEEQISRTHVFAALDTMEFLRRSGRVSGLVAGFGSLLQIKPLLKMFEGEPTSERVRTSNGAYKRIYELLKERAPFERIALVHTHAHEQVDSVLEYVQDLLPMSDLPSVDITPVIGAHIGPGAVGFACVSAKTG
jgi:DegV family protein with EDD domain